jgi:hypothetical protein
MLGSWEVFREPPSLSPREEGVIVGQRLEVATREFSHLIEREAELGPSGLAASAPKQKQLERPVGVGLGTTEVGAEVQEPDPLDATAQIPQTILEIERGMGRKEHELDRARADPSREPLRSGGSVRATRSTTMRHAPVLWVAILKPPPSNDDAHLPGGRGER